MRIKEYSKEFEKEKEVSLEKYKEEHEEELKRFKDGMTEDKLYRKNNPSTFKKAQQKWVDKNGGKEFINKWTRDYRKKPRVKLRINKQVKKRMKEDDIFNLKGRLRNNFKQAMKHYSKTGKIMSSKQYGINYPKIIEHLKPFPKDISKYEVDHIIPLSLFDHNNPEQIKKAWAPENHQWLTKEINMWKGSHLIKPLTDEEKEKLQTELTK